MANTRVVRQCIADSKKLKKGVIALLNDHEIRSKDEILSTLQKSQPALGSKKDASLSVDKCLKKLVDRGTVKVIPARKEGRTWRFSQKELEAWLHQGGPQVAADVDNSPWGK